MREQSAQINKFVESLWPDKQRQELMLQALYSGNKVARRAIIALKETAINYAAQEFWQPDAIKIPLNEISPSKDPAHQNGDYYCLDCSSAFFVSALTFLKIKPLSIIDTCAAPGGKSILSWALFQPEILISNEPINSRIPALISNLKRCNVRPAYLSCMDPAALAEATSASADLVIVDAPCSGQSMFPLGKQYASAFHKSVINKNAMRQRRILCEAAKLCAPGAYLSYTTCTFSLEENEKNLSWFLANNPEFSAQRVAEYSDYASEFSELPCYRIFPWQNLGTGGFLAVLRKAEGTERHELPIIDRLRIAWKQD